MVYQTKKSEDVTASFNFASELGVDDVGNYVISSAPPVNILHDKTSKAVRAVIKPESAGTYIITCELIGKGIKNSIQVEVSD